MALSLSKALYGVQTIQFIDSAGPTTRHSYSGIKSDVAAINLEKKETVLTLEDGQEIKTSDGWTGSIELKISQLDDTDITTLETYKPGASGGINTVKFIFTDLGSGSDTYITVAGISSMSLNVESGGTWKLVIKLGLTGAADDELTDLLTVAHA